MEAAPLKPYEIARAKIDSWRGQSLDIFAKGEKVIGQTLTSVRQASKNPGPIKVRHLAGHRADDLTKLVPELGLTGKLAKAALEALECWRTFDAKRNFLAHGVMSCALDGKGAWVGLFDMIEYRADQAIPQRWAVTEDEAAKFFVAIENAWKRLSAQLGHVRSRLDHLPLIQPV